MDPFSLHTQKHSRSKIWSDRSLAVQWAYGISQINYGSKIYCSLHVCILLLARVFSNSKSSGWYWFFFLGITVVTFVNVIFFLCKSMQICCLVISANRTSACKSPFANLFSPCKSLFGNHCVACKSVAFSDENRCNSNSKRFCSLFKALLQKTFWMVALRNTAARWFTWQSF